MSFLKILEGMKCDALRQHSMMVTVRFEHDVINENTKTKLLIKL